MTLDIAALRHRAEMAEKFANDGPDAPILDGRLRVFAKDLLALLDAAEERDRLRASLDVSRYVERTDAFLARAHAAEAQRDALLALVERAASDSCVTTSDDPGCFYCDHATHTKRCPAAAAIAAAKEAP